MLHIFLSKGNMQRDMNTKSQSFLAMVFNEVSCQQFYFLWIKLSS